MTKIFITIPWFLPAFRVGGPIQSVANLVKDFQDEVTYYIFCGDVDVNGGALENVTIGEWLPFNNNTQVWYADHEKISDSLVKQVEVIKPDILYIIGLYSWHFNIVPLIFCKGPKKILSVRGMLHPGALSQKKWKKRIYIRLFKLMEYEHKISFHATDEEEERYIVTHFGKVASVNIAGNFPNNMGAVPVAHKLPGSLNMISIALISPMKNILLVLEALGNISVSVVYNIYGAIKDIDYWKQCKEKIKGLPGNIVVKYHNEIEPGQVKEALSHSHIFVLPSKSENFGHAIYEALSVGRPAITSNSTPWNNLREANAGLNIASEDSSELTDAINYFAAMDEAALSTWSHGAIAYSDAAIDLEKIRGQYREMFSLSSVTVEKNEIQIGSQPHQ